MLWAPLLKEASVTYTPPEGVEVAHSMSKDEQGYWQVFLPQATAGTNYFYRIDGGKNLPDPASAFQPEGVFGPSVVVDHSAFAWQDREWKNIGLDQMVMYELHVGTFTGEGTFEAVIGKLDYLLELGINAIEIMPVAQFSGSRNWGYDGVFPFAVQNSYGGPLGLKKLVNTCHQRGLAVILDVVYNHLGPEGNVLSQCMPCFTKKYHTPWGPAMNYDDQYSYGVRDFFIANALHWFEHYHVDALRLDAVHGIFDFGAEHVLKELSQAVKQLSREKGRPLHLIAESDLNDVRVISAAESGGWGMDAQWADDAHHCIHTILTGEDKGYYQDFGDIQKLTKAFSQGFAYTWDYSHFRKRYHGSRINDPIDLKKLVVYIQNHDQVGNRLEGERLSALVPFEALKLGAAAYILSPFIPMLFMGEEYGEKAPFLYFMDFSDENLIKAVREGRKKEFAAFGWDKEPADPYSLQTFERSKLNWEHLQQPHGRVLFDFYKHIIALRKRQQEITLILNFDSSAQEFSWQEEGSWKLALDTASPQWLGPGSDLPAIVQEKTAIKLKPSSAAVYEKQP